MTTNSPLLQPLRQQAAALRDGTLSASELAEAACAAYASRGKPDNPYPTRQAEAARALPRLPPSTRPRWCGCSRHSVTTSKRSG